MNDAAAQTRALLAQLVAVDSTSALPNAAVIDLLEPRLQAVGFHCERQHFRDSAGIEKMNLVASTATPSTPVELALVGHTDCVPFDQDWKEALTLTEKDGRLYGRGACDTKAFVASAVIAATRALGSSVRKPLGLIFTADEEIGCTGAKKLVEERRGEARFAIVGEPTSLTPIRAHKGYCMAEIEVLGIEGHSAYPDSGASAIFRAGRFLTRLETLARSALRADADALFTPPYTTVNVGLISGGKAKNIVPGSCRFVVEWRPIPHEPVAHVPEMLERILAELKVEEPGYEARVRVVRADPGVNTPESSDLVRFLEEVSGKKASTVSFQTEAPQLTQLGAQAVVFGPGNIQVAHRTGEFVPIDELARCEEILERAIAHFCNS